MKALTVCQPYASLIASGHKLIENRTWPCPAWLIHKELLIHAGKSREWLWDDVDAETFNADAQKTMPFGALVCRVRVLGCYSDTEALRLLPEQETWINGPWCWHLEVLEVFNPPVPCKGAQGLWNYEGGAK